MFNWTLLKAIEVLFYNQWINVIIAVSGRLSFPSLSFTFQFSDKQKQKSYVNQLCKFSEKCVTYFTQYLPEQAAC